MPERIGRFRLESMLGRGAMGVVYLGHDEAIDRPVAIKLIRADLLDTEEREGYLSRFRNEARIAGRCVHANIVGLYDFALHDGNPYLVMEYVDGVGLQQFFPQGSKRDVAEILPIALQVLDALHYAHRRSIVHRDIKPPNILMMPGLHLKITDFGISRLTSTELTATPLLIGTPSYMSPEQCIGREIDGRSDLFSLGSVLYELLAGQRPFDGASYAETIFSIVNGPHIPLDRIRPDLPPGLSGAIDRALAKEPDERFADAEEFAQALDAVGRAADIRSGVTPAVIIDTRHAASAATSGNVAAPPQPAAEPVEQRHTAPEAEPAAEAVGRMEPPPTWPAAAAPEPPNPVLPEPAPHWGEQMAALSALPAEAPDDVPVAGPEATSVDERSRDRITRCLAEIMGPIAPLLVLRAEQPGLTPSTLAGRCADFIRHPKERATFLALLATPGNRA